jgi:thymidine kinase
MEPIALHRNRAIGWIEVICGSMFSGKTEELIRRLRRARFARQSIEVYKPSFDSRYSLESVTSHDENSLTSTPVHAASQILLLTQYADVVGIDEGHFFDLELVSVCEQLAARGARVIVAGLDQDFAGRPFEPMPQLMAVAEYLTKLHAVCVVCGSPANHSQRLVSGKDRLMLGASESYEPRCRSCFRPEESGDPAPADARRGADSPDA